MTEHLPRRGLWRSGGGDVVCLWVLLAVARGSTAWVLVFVGVQGVGGGECRQGVGADGSVDADWNVVDQLWMLETAGQPFSLCNRPMGRRLSCSDEGVGRRPVRCGGYVSMWEAVSGVEVKVEASQRPKK